MADLGVGDQYSKVNKPVIPANKAEREQIVTLQEAFKDLVKPNVVLFKFDNVYGNFVGKIGTVENGKMNELPAEEAAKILQDVSNKTGAILGTYEGRPRIQISQDVRQSVLDNAKAATEALEKSAQPAYGNITPPNLRPRVAKNAPVVPPRASRNNPIASHNNVNNVYEVPVPLNERADLNKEVEQIKNNLYEVPFSHIESKSPKENAYQYLPAGSPLPTQGTRSSATVEQAANLVQKSLLAAVTKKLNPIVRFQNWVVKNINIGRKNTTQTPNR